ncbi:hypothetical protein HanHA300_Chr03g0078851 [Helianthus annuus]|nr:hypothetical protein HanHA300_Chr03g0078851 [Helianthus annuus]KAJ0606888.1 hypothetical protein HanHA89_Chr03g0090221 [Helianthus annuus]KAJ0766952.1 hypothetical protein HanLR1_Chr03g0083521 [Helianthus annuus]
MFVQLTNRTHGSFIKMNVNELPAERFTHCSLNIRFVYSPTRECAILTYTHIIGLLSLIVFLKVY